MQSAPRLIPFIRVETGLFILCGDSLASLRPLSSLLAVHLSLLRLLRLLMR